MASLGCAGMALAGRRYGHRWIDIMRVVVRRSRWLLLPSPGRESPVIVARRRIIDRWRRALRRDGNRIVFLRAVRSDDGNLRLPDGTPRHRRLIIARLWWMVLCRRSGSLWASDNQGVAIPTELFTTRTMSEQRGVIPDGDGPDGRMGDGRDAFGINPTVGQGVSMAVEIVDDRSLVEDLLYMGRRHTMVVGMRVTKKPGGNKGKTIFVQIPAEADTDRTAMVKETDAGLIGGKRRQRRPAAITTRISPSHP